MRKPWIAALAVFLFFVLTAAPAVAKKGDKPKFLPPSLADLSAGFSEVRDAVQDWVNDLAANGLTKEQKKWQKVADHLQRANEPSRSDKVRLKNLLAGVRAFVRAETFASDVGFVELLFDVLVFDQRKAAADGRQALAEAGASARMLKKIDKLLAKGDRERDKMPDFKDIPRVRVRLAVDALKAYLKAQALVEKLRSKVL